jgi:hypothetical protein
LLSKAFYRLSAETVVIEKRMQYLYWLNYGLPVLFSLVGSYFVTTTMCTSKKYERNYMMMMK